MLSLIVSRAGGTFGARSMSKSGMHDHHGAGGLSRSRALLRDLHPTDPLMTRYTYPHTIENGAGERITFARKAGGIAGERLEGENVVKPGAGPPMHVHHLQEEVLTVRQGRLGYQRPGQPPQYAGPGETVTFGAGEPHKFWNAGEGNLVCTGHIEPILNVEYFLTEMFASMKRNGGGRPSLFDMAFLATRYRSEFAVLEIPPALQRAVFPMIVALGRVLGRYRQYADAPPPVSR
jgi:quercetin dioxygenase-like cupin family protein